MYVFIRPILFDRILEAPSNLISRWCGHAYPTGSILIHFFMRQTAPNLVSPSELMHKDDHIEHHLI